MVIGASGNSANFASWKGLETPPEMDERQFSQWTALLRAKTGMRLSKERKSFLITSLNLRMREIGYHNYQSYYEYLQSGKAGKLEWTALVDRLTVHETCFFRDQNAMAFLESECVEILSQDNSELQIWSAGCSTGEEPYSIAMLVESLLEKQHKKKYYGISATDISLMSLAKAKRGVFNRKRLEQVPDEMVFEYFEEQKNLQYKVKDRIKSRICFAQMNILDCATARLGKADVIYCQNLLIYFDQDKRTEILNGMVIHLKPGGVLILGPGEVIEWNNPLVNREKHNKVLAYRRLKNS